MSEELVQVQEEVPTVINESPEFDPQNPYHVRKWELAGKPDLNEVDAQGDKWRPTINYILQPDESYALQVLPEPVSPSVTAAKNFKNARAGANDFLYDLMGQVAVPMVAFASFTGASANEEGANFMEAHQVAVNAFLLSGGHPSKALKLLESIEAKQADFPWLATVIPNTGGKTILTGVLEPALTPPA